MNAKWRGLAAAVILAVAIVGYQSLHKSGTVKGDPSPVASAGSASTGSSIVLVADLGEVDDPCVCGKIIRSVKSAGTKGIPVKEIDPEKSHNLASSYKARVSPAVIILDGSGNEVLRFEGESNKTLASMQSELARLPPKRP